MVGFAALACAPTAPTVAVRSADGGGTDALAAFSALDRCATDAGGFTLRIGGSTAFAAVTFAAWASNASAFSIISAEIGIRRAAAAASGACVPATPIAGAAPLASCADGADAGKATVAAPFADARADPAGPEGAPWAAALACGIAAAAAFRGCGVTGCSSVIEH